MKVFRAVLLLFSWCFAALPAGGAPTCVDLDWRDAARDRVEPVRIYFDREAESPRPVMIFSHGLGGSREGYGYLARAWSEAGWIVVMVEHPGSNRDLLREAAPLTAMTRAAADPRNALNRPQDISFAIDMLERLNREDGEWRGRFDLERIAVGGHSFGAYTAMAIAGMKLILPGGAELSFADARVKAALVLSPTAGRNQRQNGRKALEEMKIPCFFLTGTRDDSPIGETTAAERRWAFDDARDTRFLLTFHGGDHMVFSGRSRLARLSGAAKNDETFQRITAEMSLAFLNGYVRDDEAARAELLRLGEQTDAEGLADWEVGREGAPAPAR